MVRQRRKGKKIKARKKRNLSIVILFVLAIIFSVVVTEIVYLLYNIRHIEVIDVKFEVSNIIGFALGKQELNFGAILPGGSATRYITVVSEGKQNLLVQVKATKNMRKFLFHEDNFMLRLNETKQLSFKISIPEDMEKGIYTGKIFLIFKRV